MEHKKEWCTCDRCGAEIEKRNTVWKFDYT